MKVSWDYYSQYMEKMFQTTNQKYIYIYTHKPGGPYCGIHVQGFIEGSLFSALFAVLFVQFLGGNDGKRNQLCLIFDPLQF